MSELSTLFLGSIAGGTILVGLPLGRMRTLRPGLRQFVNALAVGVLLFLIWDVLTHAFEPVDAALGVLRDHKGGIGPVLGFGALFLSGLTVGLMSLALYERWLTRPGRETTPILGSGGLTQDEAATRRTGLASWAPGRRLALLIAVGIGLHNFGEGLAIGGSAATGAISLAALLMIGFALHNVTEGFGIVAPLVAAGPGARPPWGFLVLMGAIGGGPTLVGTAVGRHFTSAFVSILFLTLAAGSIVYVVIQLLSVGHRGGSRYLVYFGVLIGLAAGFVTDMAVTAGGM